jgi:Xaa-Pro dipeptidase
LDEVYLTKDLDAVLQRLEFKQLYVLDGINDDSDLRPAAVEFKGIEKYKINKEGLYEVLNELRVFKTPREVKYMRVANLVSSQAHVYVMRHLKPGLAERQAEALFCAWSYYFGGARQTAYPCICASGPNGAVLHYGHAGRPNLRFLEDGDMMVLDMGAQYNGYATDITRSYPVNGKFTADQRAVYEAVREAQAAVMAAMKPGVSWPSMHQLAERVIIKHLVKIGILHNGTEEEMFNVHIGAVFMPHGLGHLLGLCTHDVGGYPKDGPKRGTTPGVKYLRTSRKLEEGMVITVEPGCYFNIPTLDKALKNEDQKKFIDTKVLDRFRGFGGVRLEDDVLITKDGAENLTVLPVLPDDIEYEIQKAQKKPSSL